MAAVTLAAAACGPAPATPGTGGASPTSSSTTTVGMGGAGAGGASSSSSSTTTVGVGGTGTGGSASEPVGLPLLFSDDFESGDLSHTENAIAWASSTATAVSNENAKGGKHALKFTFTGNAVPGQTTAEQRIDLHTARLEYVATYDLYLPNGTESYGGAAYAHRHNPGPNNDKFFRMWRGDRSDGNDGYTSVYLKCGASTDGPSGAGIAQLFGEYGGPAGVGPYGSDGSSPRAATIDPFVTSADLGTWVAVRWHVKAPSAANDDGVIELWKNGALLASTTNLPFYPSGGAAQNGFDFGYILGWANSGFDQTTYVFVDNVKVYGL